MVPLALFVGPYGPLNEPFVIVQLTPYQAPPPAGGATDAVPLPIRQISAGAVITGGSAKATCFVAAGTGQPMNACTTAVRVTGPLPSAAKVTVSPLTLG